jgi:hypothetical protein
MWYKKTLGVWSDLVDNSVVLFENERELIVVHLELVLLKKDDLGALWDFNADSGEALGFSDEGEDLSVEVDIQLVVLWMPDYESGLKTSFGLLNLMSPLLSPKILEGEESVTDFVVHLDKSLGLFLLDKILWELLHWSRDSVEEMSRPGNATGHSWQVTHNWWVVLVLLILVLDLMDLQSIVMEQDVVL